MAAVGEIPRPSVPSIDSVVGMAQHLPVIGKRIAGSGMPGFVRLELASLPDVDPDSIAWADEVPGDPKANRIPRWRHNAAIVGIEQDGFNGSEVHDPESGRWAKDVLVWLSDGEVKIGFDPSSEHLFGGELIDGKRLFTVAKRLGREPLKATLGQYRPDEGRLVVPEASAIVVDPLAQAGKLHKSYPNTQLVG